MTLRIQQEIEQVLLRIRSKSESITSTIRGGKQSKLLTDINGFVRFLSSPYYGLVLDTGTLEQPFILPLTLVDAARYICSWIKLVGKQVFVSEVLLVCEEFTDSRTLESKIHMNIFVRWENINIHQDALKTGLQSEIKLTLENDSSCCRVLVHHVTMPFFDQNSLLVCLVYVSFVDHRNVERKFWLLLKAEQVAMKDFLVSNREYIIQLPSEKGKDYFEKSIRPLDKIFGRLNRELRVIFHHKHMFHTLNGCELPFGSKLFLTNNTDFSEFINKFVKDPFVTWFSAAEAESASADLVTFYGEVDCVKYDTENVYKSCYFCIRARPKKPVIITAQQFTHMWLNPWASSLTNGNVFLEIPSAHDSSSVNLQSLQSGVPENMVQIIKLRDVVSGLEQSVYMKHSYLPNVQRVMRLTSGMVICITHLLRRQSASGNYYFIATGLSDFKVLSYSKKSTAEGWGLYGLRHLNPDCKDKTWGVLEWFNLIKICINAKCSYCQAVFSKGKCSNSCSDSIVGFITSATAVAWLQITCENKISKFKVVIKDKFVQILLSIPDNIWDKLLQSATQEEIIYIFNEHYSNYSEETFNLSQLLGLYCETKKAGSFFISVRRLSSKPNEEDIYYCCSLEPLNNHRLDLVSRAVT